MATPANELSETTSSEMQPVQPGQPPPSAFKKFITSHWSEQAARTTALLAVLAAVASSQYALQISRAILSQAEATDEWNHYSAKSIKKHLTLNQNESLSALALANPHLKEQLQPLILQSDAEGQRYDRETRDI